MMRWTALRISRLVAQVCAMPAGAGAVHFAGGVSDNSKSTRVFAALVPEHEKFAVMLDVAII